MVEAAEVLQQYELAHQAIEQYIANTHNEWFGTIESSIAKELQTCLLVQDKAAGKWMDGWMVRCEMFRRLVFMWLG